MCVFAHKLNARKRKEELLSIIQKRKQNILQDFPMSTFKGILKQNLE